MVGLIQRRPTTFRRIGEMSRRRRLCMRRYVLGNVQSEYMFINNKKRTGNTDSSIYTYMRGIFDEKRLDEKF